MTSYDPPTRPGHLSGELAEALEDCSADQLRDIATYAEGLAEYKAREQRLDTDGDGDDEEMPDEDRPDDVPAKASITVKEINDNRYYYWQWRDGEKTRSQYKGPVNPDE